MEMEIGRLNDLKGDFGRETPCGKRLELVPFESKLRALGAQAEAIIFIVIRMGRSFASGDEERNRQTNSLVLPTILHAINHASLIRIANCN